MVAQAVAVAAFPLVLLPIVPAPRPAAGTLVAAMVPLPVGARLAPDPTTIVAEVFEPLLSADQAVEAVPAQLDADHFPLVEL
ncbi:MAG TPA: hypothetical protein VNE83_02130 [Terriglobales bacterium]|nr:hypothetical protein [Terriglobales bacterium]